MRTTVSSGTVITQSYVENINYSANAETMPADNSIPQIGEGSEILLTTITTKNASNKVRISITGNLASSTGPDSGAVAVFINGGTNAITALPLTTTQVNYSLPISLIYEHVLGNVATHTYSVRVGVSTYSTYVNGNSSGRLYGGVARWSMLLEEVVP